MKKYKYYVIDAGTAYFGPFPSRAAAARAARFVRIVSDIGLEIGTNVGVMRSDDPALAAERDALARGRMRDVYAHRFVRATMRVRYTRVRRSIAARLGWLARRRNAR